MKELLLNDIAHGRSGDKGNISNLCVYPKDEKDYEFLKDYLTVERVKKHFEGIVFGEIKRYEVDSLKGMNFVMKEALGGGATLSLRLDSLGKSMFSALLRMKIDRNIYEQYRKDL
ncbi:hypothetical protein HMPREF1987_02070 [Peptostreptococcaceae bacterium oral taxon 113 str. W5053]|nr:hypothetical protein HMPREF1987_02070 [Peptostreptococcaceae bacterium oral taxon 113 str. W5053]